MERNIGEAAPTREERRTMQRRTKELSRRLDAWGSGDHSLPDAPPPGEWDWLLGPVVALLTQGRPAEEIAARISAELRNHFGLTMARDDVSFASELRQWWDEETGGTKRPRAD